MLTVFGNKFGSLKIFHYESQPNARVMHFIEASHLGLYVYQLQPRGALSYPTLLQSFQWPLGHKKYTTR